MLRRTTLFDLDFINDTNFDATIASMLNFQQEFSAAPGKLPLLFTPNVDDVVKLNEPKYASLATILKKSFYILPDGQPIIWASKLLGNKLQKRLPGSELFPLLWKAVIKQNKRIMVIAPTKEVGELLRKESPSMEYFVPPFFDVENKDALHNVLAGAIEIFDKIQPEYVFIGIRFPKQNHIALGLIDHVHATGNKNMPLFLLMGASYEFYLHLKKRAPLFWQRIGMEWFYRFLQEPGRLFKRYFIDDLKFIPIFFRELAKH
jgi:N-acetylglucosaminyldiphosphoundecaprenol N-acetyl-beta-D-mannosaminyltransferase